LQQHNARSLRTLRKAFSLRKARNLRKAASLRSLANAQKQQNMQKYAKFVQFMQNAKIIAKIACAICNKIFAFLHFFKKERSNAKI
jgi:hypothetical protein